MTAERIRDKFAASKRKGLWMGGRVPLGYDLKERQLRVNDAEAALVRRLYERYLEVGCVSKLSEELIAQGVLSKQRVSRRGPVCGGVAYSRGALYALLKNRLYLGEIAYRGQIYPGEHEPIIDRVLWERVQQQLNGRRKARREGVRARSPSLLVGLVYYQSGQRYTPSYSVKNAKRYRYYVIPSGNPPKASVMAPVRIPAQDLETLVVQRLLRWLSDKLAVLDALSSFGDDTALAQALLVAATAHCRAWSTLSAEQVRGVVRAVVVKITIGVERIAIQLSKSALRALLLPAASSSNTAYEPDDDEQIELNIEARLKRCGRTVRLIVTPAEAAPAESNHQQQLIHTLAQAQLWLEQLLSGEVSSLRMVANSAGLSERYVSRIIRCAFLAPDLVEAILHGRHWPRLSLRNLAQHLPLDWTEQRRTFGLPADKAGIAC